LTDPVNGLVASELPAWLGLTAELLVRADEVIE